MDRRDAIEVEALKRLVAMLLALAALAERASGVSRPVRCLVLCILRPAVATAGAFVAEVTQSAASAEYAVASAGSGDGSTDAIRLAVRFRAMACALDRLSRESFDVECCPPWPANGMRRDLDGKLSHGILDQLLACRHSTMSCPLEQPRLDSS